MCVDMDRLSFVTMVLIGSGIILPSISNIYYIIDNYVSNTSSNIVILIDFSTL